MTNKYYPKHKKDSEKRQVQNIQIFLKKKKANDRERLEKGIKILLRKKNKKKGIKIFLRNKCKSQLSVEEIII